VQHASRVCGVEGGGDLGEDLDGPDRRQGAVDQDAFEVGPVDEGHVEVELSVDLAVGVDRDHVRLVERGDQACLAAEAGAELLARHAG
jgi:hypothetical protein